MPVPNARFTELLSDIEPSATTNDNASRAHTAMRDHLSTHDDFRDLYVRSFLSGSYKRDTCIRPRKTEDGVERADVDIIVVVDVSTGEHPEVVLIDVAGALEDGGYEIDRINNRSVSVSTSLADMDIVPVIELEDGGFLVGDKESGDWIPTNPPLHIEWSKDQNALFNGRFKRMVKLVKWWRRIDRDNNASIPKRPKGFVLEMLTAMHAPTDEVHFGEAFAQLMENIHAEYAYLADAGIKPTIEDPALGYGSDILSRVSLPQWRTFLDRVRIHANNARRAQSTDDMDKATDLWRRVFGDRFKRTANAAKAVSSTATAAAPAASVGYTFPDAKATPPSKPRGFA